MNAYNFPKYGVKLNITVLIEELSFYEGNLKYHKHVLHTLNIIIINTLDKRKVSIIFMKIFKSQEDWEKCKITFFMQDKAIICTLYYMTFFFLQSSFIALVNSECL